MGDVKATSHMRKVRDEDQIGLTVGVGEHLLEARPPSSHAICPVVDRPSHRVGEIGDNGCEPDRLVPCGVEVVVARSLKRTEETLR